MFNKKAVALFFAALVAPGMVFAAQPDGPNPNRFIVKGTDGDANKEAEIEDTAKRNGGQVVFKVGKDKQTLTVVELPPQANAFGFKKKMKEGGFSVEVDHAIYPDPTMDTNPQMKTRKNLRRLAEETPWGISRVFDNVLPTVFPTSISKPICIIDSGYQLNHPDLPDGATNADPVQQIGASNSFDVDGCEHGTHVAGTIAAVGNNNQGVIGVYPNASNIKVVKVFGTNGSTSCGWSYGSSLLKAAEYCQQSGAKIITMSLGGSFSDQASADFWQGLFDEGILSIAAAGNGGSSAKSYPASYPAVMSVGATDINDNIASFSQYNDQVDISAPGVAVKSTTGSSSYSTYNGTSMATPHVSGVALLLWNEYPGCTAAEMRNVLQLSATDLGASGRDNYFGHGLVNYNSAKSFITSPGGCAAYSSPTISPAPTAAPTTSCPQGNDIEVTINADNYPSETSWRITDDCNGGAEVAAGRSDSKTICKPQGRYTFTINDSYGDGICCSYGSGSYSVKHGGDEVASGGSFTFSESTTFGSATCPGAPTNPPTTYPTSNPTATPTKSPTASPTATPTKSPTAPPVASPTSGCGTGEVDVTVDLKTDNYPGETTWNVKNCDGQVVMSGGPYPNQNTAFSESKCLPEGAYDFTIIDSYGDGICCYYGAGNYEVKYNGVTEVSGGSFGNRQTHAFGSTDGCAKPECAATEIMATVEIVTDNYPGETTWAIKTCNGNAVMEGGPYTARGNRYIESKCIPSQEAYTFQINDSYGDGICCAYGNGSYSVQLGNNDSITGGAFQSVDTKNILGDCPANLVADFPQVDCKSITKKNECSGSCMWSGNGNSGQCTQTPKQEPAEKCPMCPATGESCCGNCIFKGPKFSRGCF